MNKKEYAVAVGKHLKERREMLGKTLEQVAEFMGGIPSRSSLGAIELGRQNIDAYDLFKLEKLLGEVIRPTIKITYE